MRLSILTAAAAILATTACSPTGANKSAAVQAGTRTAEQEQNLATFDDLDFKVYSGQKWHEFHKSHAEDIVVHYPDGSTTTGLPEHLEMLTPQFVFAPDTVIKEHPIKLADGAYTAVQGFMEGTFSAPTAAAKSPAAPSRRASISNTRATPSGSNRTVSRRWTRSAGPARPTFRTTASSKSISPTDTATRPC